MRRLIEFLPDSINESISNTHIDKYVETLRNYFSKKKLWTTEPYVIRTDGEQYYSILILCVPKDTIACLQWRLSGDFTKLHSVGFTTGMNEFMSTVWDGGSTTMDVYIELNDMSVAQLLPFITNTLKGSKFNAKQIESELSKLVKTQGMYESMNEDLEELRQIFETSKYDSTELIALKQERYKLQSKLNYYTSSNRALKNPENYTSRIEQCKVRIAELDELISNNSFAVRKDVSVSFQGENQSLANFEAEFEERATPQERFADMESYVDMVLNGLQPSLLICGAPGVGKTFRIMKKVKTSGLNYQQVKGKVTPLACYQLMMMYSTEDDILVFDDADDMLTDDVITNLLKAATDSSDERIVTYASSQLPVIPSTEFDQLPPEIQVQCPEITKGSLVVHVWPRSFTTEGRIIIITNRRAGQLDTAVRNRGLICDLAFTPSECLDIVRDIMPAIDPTKLSNDAKIRALDYLQKLIDGNATVDVSIRSFCTIARIYQIVTDNSQAERMIREQMKNQAARGGKKY